MKKILLLFFCLFLLSTSQEMQAKIIICNYGQRVRTLKELPADQKVGLEHVNIGVAFKQFGIFWLPIWNYGKVEYVLVSDDEESIWALDKKTLAYYNKEFNLSLAKTPSIPLWDKIGLKPLFLLLFFLILWECFFGENKI
ncbi:MAG: hypothetical protein E6767_09885 [Dysgonomonas sp.]|nr:hypothetical protein [Dysgonomonas sp.]